MIIKHTQRRWCAKTTCGLFPVLLLMLCFLGCNSGQLPTHTVDGIVRFDDGTSPMFGDIEFYSVEHQLNARGKINRDGSFTVGTYEENDGAVEGQHQVVIQQVTGDYLTAKLVDQIDHDHGALVDPAYFDYRTSGLECVISPGTNRIELSVKKSPRQTSDGMPKH